MKFRVTEYTHIFTYNFIRHDILDNLRRDGYKKEGVIKHFKCLYKNILLNTAD